MRLEIHVHPGASRPGVGGVHDGALVVRVSAPAEGGKATAAALRAVADALDVPRRTVTLARPTTSRRKLVDLDTDDVDVDAVVEALRRLRADAPPS